MTLTGPSETADAVDFDADKDRFGAFHSAIKGNNLEDVIVILFIIQRLRVTNNTCANKVQ